MKSWLPPPKKTCRSYWGGGWVCCGGGGCACARAPVTEGAAARGGGGRQARGRAVQQPARNGAIWGAPRHEITAPSRRRRRAASFWDGHGRGTRALSLGYPAGSAELPLSLLRPSCDSLPPLHSKGSGSLPCWRCPRFSLLPRDPALRTFIRTAQQVRCTCGLKGPSECVCVSSGLPIPTASASSPQRLLWIWCWPCSFSFPAFQTR